MSGQGDLRLPPVLDEVRNRFSVQETATRVESGLCAAIGCDPVCDSILKRPLGVASGFFYLPVAQLVNWGINDEAVLDRILDLIYLTHLIYRVEDDAIDEGKSNPTLIIKAGVARHRANAIVLDLVGPDGLADGLQSQRAAYEKYARAVLVEIQHRADPSRRFYPDEILSLGDRAAPLVVVALTICHVANRRNTLDLLMEGILRLCTALQLVDDLQDVETDLANANPTWPAKSLRATYPDIETWPRRGIYGAVEALGLRNAALRIAEQEARCALRLLSDSEADVVADWAMSWVEQIRVLRLQDADVD